MSSSLLSHSLSYSSVSSESSFFTLEVNTSAVQGSFPHAFGHAVPVSTDEFGTILDTEYKDRFLNIQPIDSHSIQHSSSVVLSQYPLSKNEDKVPSISLMTYPEIFTNDEENAYQAMTAVQKQAMIDPLLQIYNQRSIRDMNLAQLDLSMQGSPHYRGAWWGNAGFHSDRMNVHYVENKDGTLRGIAFFANEGQDFGFSPVYKVVLLHPEKKIVLTAYLPLPDFQELDQFSLDLSRRDITTKEIIDVMSKGYDYLNNPEQYHSTPLGKFIASIDAFIISLHIQ